MAPRAVLNQEASNAPDPWGRGEGFQWPINRHRKKGGDPIREPGRSMWKPPFEEKNGPLASGLPPLQKAPKRPLEGWDREIKSIFRHAAYRLVSKRVLSDVNKQTRSRYDLVEAIGSIEDHQHRGNPTWKGSDHTYDNCQRGRKWLSLDEKE